MKKLLFCTAIVLLLYVSCGHESYPSFRYTNKMNDREISFETGEKDSPVYTLLAGTSLKLDSDERGRGDIVYLKPPYVIWEHKDGDVYDIEFNIDPDKKPIIVEIINNLPVDFTITEKDGYLYPSHCPITAYNETGSIPGSVDPSSADPPASQVTIYTKTPKLKLLEKNKNDKGEWVDISGLVNISWVIVPVTPPPANPDDPDSKLKITIN